MRTIRKQYWNFRFFHKVCFKNTKNALILTILVRRGWLMNLPLLFWLQQSMIKYYRVYKLLRTETFVKTVFSESEGLKNQRFDENSESDFSHKTNTLDMELCNYKQ